MVSPSFPGSMLIFGGVNRHNNLVSYSRLVEFLDSCVLLKTASELEKSGSILIKNNSKTKVHKPQKSEKIHDVHKR